MFCSNVIEFLGTCQNTNGGYGYRPGAKSEVESTRFSIQTLCLLGEPIPGRRKCVKWINQCLTSDGFASKPCGPLSLATTYYATLSLNLLTTTVPNRNSIVKFVSSLRSEGGGFRGVKDKENSMDETYY